CLGAIPLPASQRLAGGDDDAADAERQIACRPNYQCEAEIATVMPADQALLVIGPTSCRCRGPDVGCQGETAERIERWCACNPNVGSDLDGRAAAAVAPAYGAFDGTRLEARALRPVVAADQPQDLGFIRNSASLAAYLEFDRLAGPHGQPIAIAD